MITALTLRTRPATLATRIPFIISRGSNQQFHRVYLTLSDGRHTGWGEALPGVKQQDREYPTRETLEKLGPLPSHPPVETAAWSWWWEQKLPFHQHAKMALDLSLHDLAARQLGMPVHHLLGFPSPGRRLTSYTLSLDTPERMAEEARQHCYRILKLKLGGDDLNLERVKAVRRVTEAVLRVDANTAWNPDQALDLLPGFADLGVEFVEQPFPVEHPEYLVRLHGRSPLPILVDESVKVARDLIPLAPHIQGVNIKLAKTGGLHEAVKLLHLAQAYGLKVMLGCMIESSLGITAAFHLASAADYLDLDGALLLAEDPFTGVTATPEGELSLAPGPGLGVTLRPGNTVLEM